MPYPHLHTEDPHHAKTLVFLRSHETRPEACTLWRPGRFWSPQQALQPGDPAVADKHQLDHHAMQRDMNLIRDLLLFHESDGALPYPTADENTIAQHMILLVEAGFISGSIGEPLMYSPRIVYSDDSRTVTRDGSQYFLFSLTWKGHDFLAAARDQDTWNKACRAVGGLTFDIIKEYLQQILRRSVGLIQ